MSLPGYPRYKKSGEQWLETVPESWEVLAVSRLLAASVADGPHTTPVFVDEGVPFLSVDGIQDGELVFDGCRYVSEEDHREFSIKAAPRRGDVLLAKAASVGKVARVKTDTEFSIWSPLALIRVDQSRCLPEFMEYSLKSSWLQAQIETRSNSNTQLNIGMKDIPKLRMCVPSIPEQAAIVSFLDWETAKIDALIAEQQKLLALLAEKRQATISNAVTRGLKPDAPLKDSGIPWLGQVPAHWEVLPLKRDLAFLTSGSRGWAEHYSDEGALFLRIGNLTREGVALDLRDIQRVAPPEGSEGERTRVEPGDVLFSITAYLGSVAVVPDELESAYVSQHVALARLQRTHFLPKWVAYATLSRLGWNYLATQGYGGTKVQLGLDDIACLPVTAPPLDEQQSTLEFIDREIASLDSVRLESEAAIGLLRERRSALIAAAVTGKIDVRGAEGDLAA